MTDSDYVRDYGKVLRRIVRIGDLVNGMVPMTDSDYVRDYGKVLRRIVRIGNLVNGMVPMTHSDYVPDHQKFQGRQQACNFFNPIAEK